MDHHHHDFSQYRGNASRKTAIVGAVVNLILAIVKIVLGYVSRSHALVVDGIHSLSDLLSDALVWFAASHAAHGPDDTHPYGHGRFETAATLALGTMLVLVAGGIVWDALERLLNEDSEVWLPTSLGLYVAMFSILANEGLYWYTLKIANDINSPLLKANAWHHRSDAISSIVVFLGIAGSLMGYPWLDVVAAIIVGFMIAKIGWDLGWGSMQELVDASLEEDTVNEIRHIIKSLPGVQSIHMLRTRRLGHQAFADVHVQVAPRLTVSEGHLISLQVEESIKSLVPEVADVTVHIDPEDDELVPDNIELPGRENALDMLANLWKDLLPELKFCQVSFHYLSGRIDVDVYLPDSHVDETMNDLSVLKVKLQNSVDDMTVFGKVRLFREY